MIRTLVCFVCAAASFGFPPISLGSDAAPDEADDPCRGAGLRLRGRAGELATPNFPDAYHTGLDCAWRFDDVEGESVELRYRSFSVAACAGCECDYWRIIAGGRQTTYCNGVRRPPLVESYASRNVSVVFHSDGYGDVKGKGVNLAWRTVDTNERACGVAGQALTADAGVLKSPQYPHDYAYDLDCRWRWDMPDLAVVELSFVEFNVEGCNVGCACNSLRLRDGASEVGKYCNFYLPPTNYTGAAAKLVVEYHVRRRRVAWDGLVGFVVRWRRVTENCSTPAASRCSARATCRPSAANRTACYCARGYAGDGAFCNPVAEIDAACGAGAVLATNASEGVVASPHYPFEYRNNLTCRWRIDNPQRLTVFLAVAHMDVETSVNCTNDYLEIFYGERSIGRFCDEATPLRYTFVGRPVTLAFRTDQYWTGRGFKVGYKLEYVAPAWHMQVVIGTACVGAGAVAIIVARLVVNSLIVNLGMKKKPTVVNAV